MLLLLFVVSTLPASAQTSPAQAFDNVIIHTADGETINDGTVVWRNGIIESAGSNVTIPFDAYVIDGGDSLHVYPGFIDGLALWGSPDLPDRYERPDRPGDPGYERAGIQPQRKPSELLKSDDKNFEEAQKHGFTTAGLGLKGQMLPGQVDIFFINGEKTGDHLMKSSAGISASFEDAPGGFGSGAYPSTTMGVLAQYRQLWYDAEALMNQQQYFASAGSNYPAPAKDAVLEALYPVLDMSQPLYFTVDSKENIELLLRLKDEIGFDAVIVSGKEAYKMADEISDRDIPVLASIDLPDEPEWKKKEREAEEDTTQAGEELEELTEEMRIFRDRQLRSYEASIMNIKSLMDAGVTVGYASNGMKLGDLSGHVKTLLEEGGLDQNQLLRIMSQNTAEILGIGNRVGELENGRIASFSVFTKPYTEEKTKVLYSVSSGMLTEF
ncbi:amidohydrolase family protein [Balneolaceae bacterium YR4-1]|uniref:Amidohydrolase family protein n=2 Tax=Halalkalibaculum roseum TaxID=2709311 RepID=A0A6M1SN57_9BACT|nr:amidohydrolase family protein [Halalkalibaculum roseum]